MATDIQVTPHTGGCAARRRRRRVTRLAGFVGEHPLVRLGFAAAKPSPSCLILPAALRL